MEVEILKSLEFSLDTPGPLHFLARYVHVAGVSEVHYIINIISSAWFYQH